MAQCRDLPRARECPRLGLIAGVCGSGDVDRVSCLLDAVSHRDRARHSTHLGPDP